MESFCEIYDVSRETFDKLKICQKLLGEWQQKFNLVSNSSLPDAWKRHFLDSAQLFPLIPQKAKILFDLGSGAGFPGLVLAILAAEKMPGLRINLVESTTKKTLYLNTVVEALGLNVTVINERIENIGSRFLDVITSRALAPLDKLLDYSSRFCNSQTVCLFPKGRTYNDELEKARQEWNFECTILPNAYSSEGKILKISNIEKRRG